MSYDIGPLICAFLICLGAFFLITGIGGGGYNFSTGEWFIRSASPTNTRIVGAIMIAFGILLPRMISK